MYCQIATPTRVILRRDEGGEFRRYDTRDTVASAVVSGEGDDAKVTINFTNGKVGLYAGSGRLIRMS